MGRHKGTPKTGGRQAGSLNKNTKVGREKIMDFIENNWENVQTYFDELEPREKLQFMEKLLPYVVPKQTEVGLSGSIPERLEIVHVKTGHVPVSSESDIID